MIRFAKRRLPATDQWNGVKLTVMENGKRLITPMAIVIIALGTTDLLFALDSIPAIYGLTQEPFLVFTANVFALMGLRQLYFLLGDLLRRLVYLSFGLAVVLAFIGVKLVLHAMHENELPFINGGDHVSWAPEIPIWLSLGFIVVTLGITTILSLAKSRKDAASGAAVAAPEAEPTPTDAGTSQHQHHSRGRHQGLRHHQHHGRGRHQRLRRDPGVRGNATRATEVREQVLAGCPTQFQQAQPTPGCGDLPRFQPGQTRRSRG